MTALDIYRDAGIIATVSIDEQTVLVKKLMNADKITSSFISATVLPLELGDYILYDGVKYTLNQLPIIEKVNDATYKYACIFQGILYDLLKKLLISSDGLTEFSYTGNAEYVLTLIVSNLNNIYTGWEVGTVDTSETKTFEFANDTCRTALTKVAEAFNFEFELIGKTIHLKEAVGTVRALTFKYGEGNGLYSLTRKTVEDNSLITRLYAFGSTKNLPYTYRSRAKRLVFESRFLEKNTAIYGINEGHFIDDEIFPNRTAPITATSEVFTGNDMYVEDSSIDFNINDFISEVLKAKIVFKTGNLSGYEFEIWKFDWENKRIYFNNIQESDDYIIPNETRKPEIGDTYTLVDINMPELYIINAEANLKAAAQKYLDANCVPKLIYVVKIDPKFTKADDISLDAGDLVTIEDTYLGIDRAIRVNQVTFPIVNKYKIDAVIADFIPYTLQERVTKATIVSAKAIQNIKNTINNTTSNTVINNSDTTINEGNIRKISINGLDYNWEKAFDNEGIELEVSDIIYGNYWNRYIFVSKWKYLGGIKELRTSWDELETLDETP